jgi:hypothetical protein
MRRTIVMLLLLVVVAWSAPPQLEDVSGQCRALESQVLREQARRFPDSSEDASVRAGLVAQRVMQYARDAHGSLPPGLSCFLVYAEILYDSDLSAFQPPAAP